MTTPTPPAAPAPTPAAAPAAPSSGGSVPRLRNGELRAMVARVLADAGKDLTPRNIACRLNPSRFGKSTSSGGTLGQWS